VIDVRAWDANCPQHIPQRFEAADVALVLERRDQRIAELEGKLAELERTITTLRRSQPRG
jgi:hypothetical protein